MLQRLEVVANFWLFISGPSVGLESLNIVDGDITAVLRVEFNL